MRPETDIASEEYEDLLGRVESVEKTTKDLHIGGDVVLGNVHALGLITGIFRSGTGIKDTDLTGFQMDGDELVGQASGVDQVVLDAATGLLTAGAGKVTLDVDGITIDAGETIDNAVAWVDSSDNVLGKVYAYEEASGNRIMVSGHGIGADYGSVMLQGVDANADDSYIRVASTDGIWLDVTDATVSKVVDVRGGDLRIITAQKKIQFVDSNTEIWEDASSNLSFKDANASTCTLNGLKVGTYLDGQTVTIGTVQTDTINEETATAGVTIDGVKLKDSEPYCDVINEKTGAAGVTIDSLLIKDGAIPKIVLGAPTELTLDAAGAIAVTQSNHIIDTFEDAGADDLVTISGGSVGQRLVLRTANAGRDVTVKDASDNIYTAGDCVLGAPQDKIELIKETATYWVELNRSINA